MVDTRTPRIPIEYRTQKPTNLPLGPRTIMLFYPDGEWDGWRRRPSTCEAAYPQSKYRWINMDETIDIATLLATGKDPSDALETNLNNENTREEIPCD